MVGDWLETKVRISNLLAVCFVFPEFRQIYWEFDLSGVVGGESCTGEF